MNENEDMKMIPYTVHESDMARMDRQNKRLWIVLIMTIVFLVVSNAAWIYFESQWETVETVTQEVTQEADNGINRFIGGDYYGEADGQNN